MKDDPGSGDWRITLPIPECSLEPSHLRQAPTWIAFMREMEAEWRWFMREHDTPEQRLATKVPMRFKLDA